MSLERIIEGVSAGEAKIRMVPMTGRDAYVVEVVFPMDTLAVEASEWANPMRVALDAAEAVLNELKCACFNEELNSCRRYRKDKASAEASRQE